MVYVGSLPVEALGRAVSGQGCLREPLTVEDVVSRASGHTVLCIIKIAIRAVSLVGSTFARLVLMSLSSGGTFKSLSKRRRSRQCVFIQSQIKSLRYICHLPKVLDLAAVGSEIVVYDVEAADRRRN